ncbi:MAG: hypothetical protein ACRDIB_01910, partial [Ardenticatenaceae bacterium]
MKFPWANTLLLVFIAAEVASGFFGLVSGSPDRAIFIQSHRVSGYGILAILLWKSRNIRHSLRFPRRRPPCAASLVLLAALLVTLALGFVWSFVGPFGFWLFSGVSWHIYIGAALVPILMWHSIYHTRGFPIGFWADRRAFLRLTGITALGILLWQFGEFGARLGQLSGATRRFTGSYEVNSFSGNDFPRVSWLNDAPRQVDVDRWRLTIGGAVEREVTLSYQDLP